MIATTTARQANLIFQTEHLSKATTEGLDLTLFVPATWTQAKKFLSEIFKEYDLAKEKINKSAGSHKKDIFGSGFTKDLAVYYFHLLLDSKPEAHKGITAMLDKGVFYIAGGAPALDGGSKHPAATALEKKEIKAERQTGANLQGAKDMRPIYYWGVLSVSTVHAQREIYSYTNHYRFLRRKHRQWPISPPTNRRDPKQLFDQPLL
jgi:hypothetical protein